MQVNITDEMIEQMVREQVKARVNQYFGELKKEDSYFLISEIKSAIMSCSREEVENVFDEKFVNGICSDLAKSNLKEQIVERFATKIASVFNEEW